MFDVRSLLKRFKRNAFAFALTFVLSLSLPSLYPAVRNFISWHAQYQLCQAAAQGKTTRVNLLVLAGTNPNGFNTTYVPLHFAARYSQTEVVRTLLDAGANPNSVGNMGQTALMEAINSHNLETTRLLISRGADLTQADSSGRTSLSYAVRQHNPAIVELLLSQGEPYFEDAAQTLCDAVTNRDAATVRMLLAAGVDPRDLIATPRELPLTTVAAMNHQPEVVKMLRAAGAK